MTEEERKAAEAAAASSTAEDEFLAKREARKASPDLDPRLQKLKDIDEGILDYVLDTRYEKEKSQRKSKEQLAEKDAEIARLKAEKDEGERKKLEENQQYKELADRERDQRQKTRAKLVDSKIEAEIARRGYHEDGQKMALKLMERKGIEVDADDNVSGIERAIERMESEYRPEIFKTISKGREEAEDQSETKKPPVRKPADGESVREFKARSVGDAGAELPPAKTNQKPKFDARKANEEDYQTALDKLRYS